MRTTISLIANDYKEMIPFILITILQNAINHGSPLTNYLVRPATLNKYICYPKKQLQL